MQGSLWDKGGRYWYQALVSLGGEYTNTTTADTIAATAAGAATVYNNSSSYAAVPPLVIVQPNAALRVSI